MPSIWRAMSSGGYIGASETEATISPPPKVHSENKNKLK
jgi:hypothetical protein